MATPLLLALSFLGICINHYYIIAILYPVYMCTDFGVDHLVWVAEQTTFPWLMSNVREKATGELLANGHERIVMEWQGRKV